MYSSAVVERLLDRQCTIIEKNVFVSQKKRQWAQPKRVTFCEQFLKSFCTNVH